MCPNHHVSKPQVEFSWESLDSDLALPPRAARQKDLVLPPPVAATPGMTYRMRLRARFAGSQPELASESDVMLYAVGSPLVAELRGPAGDVRSDRTIVLDASASRDPDDPAGSVPLTFGWTCTRADWPVPCFANVSRGELVGGGARWILPLPLLEQDIAHTFRMILGKASSGDARSAAAELTMTPRSPVLPIPTGRLSRLCGRAGGVPGSAAAALVAALASNTATACPQRHGVDAPLSLLLRLDAGFESANITWLSEQVPSLAAPGTLGTPAVAGSAQLTLPASELPPSGGFVLVTALLSYAGINGSTTLSVPLNSAPTCGAAIGERCLRVETLDDSFGSAAFAAMAVDFTDDSAGVLMYDFGTLDAVGVRRSWCTGSASMCSFTGLPMGNTTLVRTCS